MRTAVTECLNLREIVPETLCLHGFAAGLTGTPSADTV